MAELNLMNWHLQTLETSLETLQTGPKTGLSQTEAESRLLQYGRNELVEKGGRHTTGHFLYAGTLFRQFMAIYYAGTAFQHTRFSPKRKNVQ
jgi:magnesium-transporting ATPase (P-type)